MARRKSSLGRNKIQPAVQTLTFVTPGPGAAQVYIDLSQAASLANRRFYRQGINWAVSGIKVISSQPGTVSCYKLPNTWIMANSWQKSFSAWQRMNNEALAETESVRPKFLDFKIYADADHHQLGYGANLLPVAPFGGPTVEGEWESSKVVIPSQIANTTESFELVAVGPNAPGISPVTGLNALSLIEGYASSRALPNIEDPNVPDDASNPAENWIQSIFSDGTQQDTDVIADMSTENNIAPYPFENSPGIADTMYPGGANQLSGLQWHDATQIFSSNATFGVGTQRIKGGNFPCGLVRLDWTPDSTNSNLIIQVDLIPGNHRGYLCEPMTEM